MNHKKHLPYGVETLVTNDGKFLCATRNDTGEIRGPGGYIMKGESPEDAAARTTQEQFGITPNKLIRIGCVKSRSERYCPTMIFLCTDYDGTPDCTGNKLSAPEFMDVCDIDKREKVNPVFDYSLDLLTEHIHGDMNPYHDKNGRFTNANGVGNGSAEGFSHPRRLSEKDWDIIDTLIETAENNGVAYHKVKLLDKPLAENEIIARVARRDPTNGSCVSVALAYVGNKFGLDVQDFRGGKSLEFFCQDRNTRKLYDVSGCDTHTFVRLTETWSAKAALQTMQEGREYILHAGQHASIVRRHNKKIQYLELQKKASLNGWHTLTRDVLLDRFETDSGESNALIPGAILTNVDSLNHEGLREVLGYINTAY